MTDKQWWFILRFLMYLTNCLRSQRFFYPDARLLQAELDHVESSLKRKNDSTS